jgi:hypothetical protein
VSSKRIFFHALLIRHPQAVSASTATCGRHSGRPWPPFVPPRFALSAAARSGSTAASRSACCARSASRAFFSAFSTSRIFLAALRLAALAILAVSRSASAGSNAPGAKLLQCCLLSLGCNLLPLEEIRLLKATHRSSPRPPWIGAFACTEIHTRNAASAALRAYIYDAARYGTNLRGSDAIQANRYCLILYIGGPLPHRNVSHDSGRITVIAGTLMTAMRRQDRFLGIRNDPLFIGREYSPRAHNSRRRLREHPSSVSLSVHRSGISVKVKRKNILKKYNACADLYARYFGRGTR